jgi:hypothetical protein
MLHIWKENPENLKTFKFNEYEDEKNENEDEVENETADFDVDTKFTLDDFTIATNSSSEEGGNQETS